MNQAHRLFVSERWENDIHRSMTLPEYASYFIADIEDLFGSRDRSFSLVGIDVDNTPHSGPMLWYPDYGIPPNNTAGRSKHIIIRLGLTALADPLRARWQLAHECVHLLDPWNESVDGRPTNWLEEGIAAWYQNSRVPEAAWRDGRYGEAEALVEPLLRESSEAIKNIRQDIGLRLGEFTPDVMRDYCVGIDENALQHGFVAHFHPEMRSSMTYREEEIIHRLQLGEDSAWEFKEVIFTGSRPTSPRRDDWADEIAAFANANGGTLLCGVSDVGDIRDMSRQQMDELERLIVEVCSDSIQPPIRVNIFRRRIGGKPVLIVETPEGHAQHDSPGGSFIRVGSSKRKMTSEERLRLAQRRGQARFLWFDKRPIEGTGFGTLDEALWKPLLSVEGAIDPVLALEKMGLLAEERNGSLRATIAGVLLCCNSPENWLPNACIYATKYKGLDRSSGQLDSQIIVGPIDKQIRESLAFVVRNMSVAARKEPARQEMPQYSVRAVFEALVNAVVHRDYSIQGSGIRLAMFEDRLEIHSPGGLPNNLTVASMGERQSTRNEILTSVLGRMNAGNIEGAGGRQFFMERRGDGVPIIRRETQELCGSLPRFRLVDNAELCLDIPAASLEFGSANVVITVHSSGNPLPNAEVLAIFPNKTWKHAVTDYNGEARIDLHSIHLPMTIFAAAAGFGSGIEKDWIPAKRPMALELSSKPHGGSLIFQEATGHIPGLSGRLNPIRDTLDRTYLYASNISINDGRQQPVHFALGEDLMLTDSNGKNVLVRIIDIVGRSALLEYYSISAP